MAINGESESERTGWVSLRYSPADQLGISHMTRRDGSQMFLECYFNSCIQDDSTDSIALMGIWNKLRRLEELAN